MNRTFSDSQIEEFMQLHLTRHPDAIERMHFVMTHPLRDNKIQIAANILEIEKTGEQLEFFHAHAKAIPEHGYYHAKYELIADVLDHVAAMLGPIGSYEIEE